MTDKISRYDNVETTKDGDYLIIKCLLDEEAVDVQPSQSGKTFVVATTGGAIRVDDTPYRLNLTLYRKP